MKYTYGPVPSRRLGRSLGVDLVPKKICTYDCIYCQIGRTTHQTIERKEYSPVRFILRDVKETLKEWHDKVDYVAISGSGEPTLNNAIGEVIDEIKKMTSVPVAVITNSSLMHLEEVRKALIKADLIMPSLDAATPSVFRTVNRPYPSLEVTQIIDGLTALRGEYKGKIWLEILLCRGVNDGNEEIDALREAIRIIRPDKVHLNTVVRPGAENYAAALSQERMEQIRAALGKNVEIIAEFAGHEDLISSADIEEKIIRTVQRRPETPDGLAKALGLHELEVVKVLDKLAKKGRVKYRVFNQRLYYEVVQKEK
ncbi:MAG: radical SAM protein [Deltaproteobacteria bacterium]|nr:radical SAM protein [Deltaproteobacteria bacterium]